MEGLEAGASVREVAREHGRSPSTVSGVARAAGVDVGGRDQTKAATDARLADRARRQGELASALLDDAERLRRELFAPCVERKAMTVALGRGAGSKVEIVDVLRDQPTHEAQARIMVAIGIAVDKVLAISNAENAGRDDSAVDGWLLYVVGGQVP